MEVVTSVLRIFEVCNTPVTDKMKVVTSVWRLVIHLLQIFIVCHTPITDKVKVVTAVLRFVTHSLHLCSDLSYNRYWLAPSRYGFSGYCILPEIMPMQAEINPKLAQWWVFLTIESLYLATIFLIFWRQKEREILSFGQRKTPLILTGFCLWKYVC